MAIEHLKDLKMYNFILIFIIIVIQSFIKCDVVSNQIQPNFVIPIELQQQWIIENNRIDIPDIFSPDYWFPIEINVPDTIMSVWHSAMDVWMATSDYFSMNNDEQIP